jgi:predicted outer membrane repeat protein
VAELEIGALSAIATLGTTLNVTRSTFTGNSIGDGASVLLLNSTNTTISGSTFSRNVVTQFGGAISAGSGSLVVQDSTFIGNVAGATGGAINFQSSAGSSATFQNVTFADNIATCRGGSLSFSGVDVIVMAACTFTNSSVPEWANSPDAGGQCITGLQLAYTAGAAVFAKDFRAATITSSSFDRSSGNGDGAVFINNGAKLRLQDVNVTNSVLGRNGRSGGCFLVSAVTIAIADRCNFTNNAAPSSGGLKFTDCDVVNVTNSSFHNNQGLLDGDGFGGGLYIEVGCTEGCLVNGNNFTLNKVVEGAGGGFYSASPATMVVTNNRFTQNLAGSSGGGMTISGAKGSAKSSLVVQRNVFLNNTVAGLPGVGGGFALDMMPIMEVSDCTFGGNTASEAGGGMYLAGADTSIVNALNLTLTGNSVQALTGAGGGMYVTAGIVNGSQLIFADNRAWTGAGMHLQGLMSATIDAGTFSNNVAGQRQPAC